MRRMFILMLFAVINTTISMSQETLSLTVDKAIQIGLDNSKVVHASLMRVNYADAKEAEINASRLPSLKVAAGYTRLSDTPPFTVTLPQQLGGNTFTLAPSIVNNYALKATVEQPLFTGFRLSAASDAAEYNSLATEQDHARVKSDLVYNVRASYWMLFKAMEIKKVNDENVEQMKSHLKDVQSMLDQGMATTNDLLKVQVQFSDAQLRQIESNNNVQLATIGLNNTLGIPLQTKITIDTDIKHSADINTSDLNSLIAKADERRPELKASGFRVKAAEAGITAAKSAWWPQIYFAANYNYNRPNQRIQPTQDIFKDTWDVSLGVSLDIWNWGKTLHQSDQASAQYEEAKDALSQAKDAITLELTQVYLNLNQAKERIDVARQGMKQAEESYRVTNQRFREGLAQNSDLLDAEVALLQARTSSTQALVDYELAEARLQKAIGE